MIIERFSRDGFTPPWIIKEHEIRYDFVASYISGKDVVDCACGSGESSYLFSLKEARYVLGVDCSNVAIDLAKDKFVRPNLDFVVGDAIRLPINDSTFDVFVSLETVEHIQADNIFISEVKRILKPGGLFICSTPNRKITNPGTKITDKPWNVFHVREYDFVEFMDLVEREFVIEKIFGQHYIHESICNILDFISIYLGKRFAVRVQQVMKLRFLFSTSTTKHKLVDNIDGNFEYQLIVARKVS